jgi:hypothetical protein
VAVLDPRRHRREQHTNGRSRTEMIIAHRSNRRHRFDAGVFLLSRFSVYLLNRLFELALAIDAA